MRSFSFTVVGVPLAMPRARATATIMRIAGKLKAIPKVYIPEDDDIRKFKHDVAFEARKAFHVDWPDWDDKSPLDIPVAMELRFIFPRPKALTWKKKPMIRMPMRDVPDLDNLIKSVCDALNGVVYVDDRQVWSLSAHKVYSDGAEPPAVQVTIRPVEPHQVPPKEQNGKSVSPENQQLQEDQPD